jgi:hypothetical protein
MGAVNTIYFFVLFLCLADTTLEKYLQMFKASHKHGPLQRWIGSSKATQGMLSARLEGY